MGGRSSDEKTVLVEAKATGFALTCPPFGTRRVKMLARTDYHLVQTIKVVTFVNLVPDTLVCDDLALFVMDVGQSFDCC